MLAIVILKPIQITKVIAVPRYSGAEVWAVRVENWGESAMTAIPHITINNKNNQGGTEKKSGARMQQAAEQSNA